MPARPNDLSGDGESLFEDVLKNFRKGNYDVGIYRDRSQLNEAWQARKIFVIPRLLNWGWYLLLIVAFPSLFIGLFILLLTNPPVRDAPSLLIIFVPGFAFLIFPFLYVGLSQLKTALGDIMVVGPLGILFRSANPIGKGVHRKIYSPWKRILSMEEEITQDDGWGSRIVVSQWTDSSKIPNPPDFSKSHRIRSHWEITFHQEAQTLPILDISNRSTKEFPQEFPEFLISLLIRAYWEEGRVRSS